MLLPLLLPQHDSRAAGRQGSVARRAPRIVVIRESMYSASVSFSVSSAVFSPCVSMILALVSVGQACRLRGEWRAVPRIGASSTTSNHSLQHEYVGDECRSLVARRRASRGSHSGQSGLSALGTGVRSGPCLVVPCRLIPLTSGKTISQHALERSKLRSEA